MPDFDVLLSVMKRSAMDAMNESNPCDILFGTVLTTAPLLIQVDGEQKMKLEEDFLILTRSVRDYNVEMTVEHETEETGGGSGYAAFAGHKHEYKGRKTYHVHNALQEGEKVILLQAQHGNAYVVWDRLKG